MSKLVCHAAKFQKSGISKIEGHNERKNRNSSNKDIDWSKVEQNYSIISPPENQTYYRAAMNIIDQRYNPSGRALRKDAVHLVEFIISSDMTFFDDLSEREMRNFFERSTDFLSEYFGKENVIYAKVHMDEPSKHLHFGFVPMTADNRLCAKEVINKKSLKIIQAKMPEFLKSCGFDIQRGEENSDKKHLEPHEYKAAMEREKKALDKIIGKQKNIKAKLDCDISERKTEKVKMEKDISEIKQKKIKLREMDSIEIKKIPLTDKVALSQKDCDYLVTMTKRQIAKDKDEDKLKSENKSLKMKISEMGSVINNLQAKIPNPQSMRDKLARATEKSHADEELRKLYKVEKFVDEMGLSDRFRLWLDSNRGLER